MNYLSLFSGAGGGDLAFQHLLEGFKCIGYVEIEGYCQQIIAQRIKDGLMHNAPIFTDIRAFIDSGCCELYTGVTDLITGGFPCQDISTAGGPNREGIKGKRSGLWNEMAYIIRKVRPKHVFVENSPALTFRGIGTVLGDLASMGFNAKWGVFSAGDIGARHERQRIWIFAYIRDTFKNSAFPIPRIYEPSKKSIRAMSEGISSIPDMGRKIDGLASWMDRLKAIGNGQVPQVAATAWNILA